MAKYRKKPVVVEAYQWHENMGRVGAVRREAGLNQKWYVVTMHLHRAYIEDDDWIVTEPDGNHHYPVKPEIFAETYEVVADDQVLSQKDLAAFNKKCRSGESVDPDENKSFPYREPREGVPF